MNEQPSELGRWMAGAVEVGTGATFTLLLAGVVFNLPLIAACGLLLLTMTPALPVGVAAVGFGRRGELRYSLLATVALGLLLTSLVVAALAGRWTGG